MATNTAQNVVYKLRLDITVPLDDYAESDTLTPEANATCLESKREIEQMILHCLRRLGAGEATDIEVMDVSIEDE